MNNNAQSDAESTLNGHSNGQAHLPFWKAGSGHYGDTLGQQNRETVVSSVELILSYIDKIPVKENEVFTIGDYGTNDGFTSMPLMNRVIDHLRQKHGERLPIQVIYEDQEKNDFNSLFARLSDSSSYMSKHTNVYPMAVNVGFYKQCVPDNSCHVIFTSAATHWLDKLDMNFKDCVFDTSASPEERREFDKEADRDWTKFLMLRARELKANGLLVVLALCTGEPSDPVPGEVNPAVPSSGESEVDLFLDLEEAWRELRSSKVITQKEYEKCTARKRFRTAEESRRPFVREDSAVQGSGLRLVHYDQIFVPCVFKTFWRNKRDLKADEGKQRALFADLLVPAHRVWSQTTFHSSLSDMRTEAEKAAILEELYSRFHALVMKKDPGTYNSDIFVSRLIARKA